MEQQAGAKVPEQLIRVKTDVLRLGRYLLTFLGVPIFVMNSVPVWLSGNAGVFLWVQTVVFPGAVILAWLVRSRSLEFQAMVLALPVTVVSVASIGQWGLTFGAGILQMAVLSLLLVFFYTNHRTFFLFTLLVLLADLALGFGIIHGWFPAPDLRHVDATLPENWRRIFMTSAAAIPVTLFILARALHSMVDALQESEERLAQVRKEQAEKEEAQKALSRAQRMEVVGRLASGLSHDFNNALTLIRGSAELLQFGADPEEMQELTDNIIRASDNAADLSRRLLIFSREGQSSDPQPVDLGASLQKLGKSLRRLLPSEIEVNIMARATMAARVDPSQLDQAILNLCLNARDAMPRGGWLELSAQDQPLEDGTPGVVIQVRDSGMGMDSETLARATEPFFTTKAEGKGTGLGLAMVRKMVDQHGGQLEMDSRLGLGSSFAMRFPAWTETAGPASTAFAQRRSRGSILLVDDDPGVRRTLERVLETGGHRVVVLGSAGEAGALLSAEYDFDLLITDGVPQREHTPHLIHRFLDGSARGRVLVYTGYSPEQLEDRGLEVGGRVSVAQKPLPSQELLQRISDLMEMGRASDGR